MKKKKQVKTSNKHSGKRTQTFSPGDKPIKLTPPTLPKLKNLIKLYADGVYLGNKTDTFWSISKETHKPHSIITPEMLTNLLFILNDSKLCSAYPYYSAKLIEIHLCPIKSPEKILSKRIFTLSDSGEYSLTESIDY